MKRLIGGALVASLAFAAAALASNTNLAGPVEGGGKITMTLVDNGQPQVKNLEIHHVPIQCAHGKFKVGVDTSGQTFTPAAEGQFSAIIPLGGGADGKLKIKVKLRNGGDDALGGLRVLGDGVRVDGRRKPQNGCDTGRVLWTAMASS
jgi:hypothetical protein